MMTTRRRWLWNRHDDDHSCFMMIIITILQPRISSSWPRVRFTIFLCRHNDEHIQWQSSPILLLSNISWLGGLGYSHVSWMAGADDPKELGGHSEASPCPGEELQVFACPMCTGHRSRFHVFHGIASRLSWQTLFQLSSVDEQFFWKQVKQKVSMPTNPQSRAHAEMQPFLEVVETERPQTLQKVVKRRIWDCQFPVCGMEGHGVHCFPWIGVENGNFGWSFAHAYCPGSLFCKRR